MQLAAFFMCWSDGFRRLHATRKALGSAQFNLAGLHTFLISKQNFFNAAPNFSQRFQTIYA
jgi:hypothetical protein